MTARNVLMTAIVGLLCLGAASRTNAEDRDPVTERDRSISQAAQNVDPTDDVEAKVTKANKASGLIGMEVRNHQNEKLGDIKDLVLDLSSGRVSYLVLSSGGFLGVGDRLMAIPPSTFEVSGDSHHLVLNADKAKIMNAPTFASTNWPDPLSGNFEAYWMSDRDAVGAPSAEVSVGAGAGESSRKDRDYTENKSSRDYQERATYDRGRDSSERPSWENQVFKGRITAINPETRTMTVEGEDGSRDFTFTDRPTLTLKKGRNAHLIDFKVGYPVTVGYHEEGENCVAHGIKQMMD